MVQKKLKVSIESNLYFEKADLRKCTVGKSSTPLKSVFFKIVRLCFI